MTKRAALTNAHNYLFDPTGKLFFMSFKISGMLCSKNAKSYDLVDRNVISSRPENTQRIDMQRSAVFFVQAKVEMLEKSFTKYG